MTLAVMKIVIEIAARHLNAVINLTVDCETGKVLVAETDHVSKINLTRENARNFRTFYRALQSEYPKIGNLSESKLKELVLNQLAN